MLESDRTNFTQLMQQIAELYEKSLSPALLEIYWEDLKGFNFSDVRAAIRAHRQDIQSGKYMPKPADLIKLLKEDKHQKIVRDLERDRNCSVIENGSICRSTVDLVPVIGSAEKTVYWCGKHFSEKSMNWRDVRKREGNRRAKELMQKTGKSAYELAKEEIERALGKKEIFEKVFAKLQQVAKQDAA